MDNITKILALDEKILKQPRWINWFLEGKQKKPACEWQDYNNRKPFHDVKGNVGIVFDSRIDQLCGLDLDDCIYSDGVYTEQAIRAMELFAGKAYIERSISGNGLHFLFYSDLDISFNAKPIEYYSTGRYFVFSKDPVQGSVPTPQDCSKEIRQFIQQFIPYKLNPKPKSESSDIGLVSTSKVREALAKIDPDCNRGDWFTVAAALNYEFEGEDKGFELFHEWSSRALQKYIGEADCKAVWDSLGNYPGKPTTIGSLFDLAKCTEFSPVYEDPSIHGQEPKKRWLTTADLDAKLGPISWLVQDYFEANTISIIWGDTMAFKSFLALEVCFCVAAGLDWHGLKVNQGAVLYVCGEGSNGIARRIAGLKQKYGTSGEIPLFISNGSRDIIEAEAIKEIIAYGKSLETSINLVMIDTVNRNFSGEENSSKDVARAYKHLDHIKDAFNCSISMVHHTGKSGKIIRGSAAWVQNVDASYEMSRSNNTFYTKFIAHKLKDAAVPDEICFEMKEIAIKSKGHEGELLTTLISKTIDEIPVTQTRKERGPTSLILKCLEENGGKASRKELANYLVENGQPIGSITPSLSRMTEKGEIIRIVNGGYELPPEAK